MNRLEFKATNRKIDDAAYIELGKRYAQFIGYLTEDYYEPHEFESEDIPEMLEDGMEFNIIE